MVADDAGAPGKAVAEWLSVWSAELKRVQELTFAARREWLRRLEVEVTVAKAGSGLPRLDRYGRVVDATRVMSHG